MQTLPGAGKRFYPEPAISRVLATAAAGCGKVWMGEMRSGAVCAEI